MNICLDTNCSSTFPWGTDQANFCTCGNEVVPAPLCICGKEANPKALLFAFREGVILHCQGCGRAWNEVNIASLMTNSLKLEVAKVRQLMKQVRSDLHTIQEDLHGRRN